VASKPAAKPAASAPVAAKPAPQVAPKSASSQPAVQAGAKPAKSVAKKPAKKVERVEVESKKNPLEKSAKKETPKAISLTGRRDPFVSPVVARSMTGSGCSTGKRCLAVDQISLKGVVKSDTGMIAVVVNAVNKAYFLRENDPVFNGYVVKITGDSIIFKETLQDKLGKSFTREVTKKITTPAV
jgi:Tfp pilus assembly protein PilP